MKIMLSEMKAERSKSSPYLNGTGTYTPPKLFTESKSIYPSAHDNTYPTASPITMELILR